MDERSVYVPRLKEAFSAIVITQAIVDAAKVLGYTAPRTEQVQAVEKFVSGRDVFVSLPTGGEKSLCYACLPLVYDTLKRVQQQSIVIVVSPLNALKQDQVASFMARGLKAAYIQGDGGDAVTSVLRGEVQLVYASTEMLILVPKWRELLRKKVYQNNVVCLAVDEAHLVEKWGNKFHVEFSHNSEIRSLVPRNTNVMALTATANLRTREVVIKSLEMKGCFVLAQNPNNTNIYYEVAEKTDIDSVVKPIVAHVIQKREDTDRRIIFCHSYKDCSDFFETLTLQLAENNVLLQDESLNVHICEKFTACSSPNTKKNVLKSFTQPNGLVRIVVATVAFGMGLDSPNVRYVIHWGPPNDIELYVQETGCGGLDGKPACSIQRKTLQ